VHDRPAALAPGGQQRRDRCDRGLQPKPPGSMKSRCMSMTTSAVLAAGKP